MPKRLSRAIRDGDHVESVAPCLTVSAPSPDGRRTRRGSVLGPLAVAFILILAFVAWTACGSPKLIEDYPLSTDYGDGGAR